MVRSHAFSVRARGDLPESVLSPSPLLDCPYVGNLGKAFEIYSKERQLLIRQVALKRPHQYEVTVVFRVLLRAVVNHEHAFESESSALQFCQALGLGPRVIHEIPRGSASIARPNEFKAVATSKEVAADCSGVCR